MESIFRNGYRYANRVIRTSRKVIRVLKPEFTRNTVELLNSVNQIFFLQSSSTQAQLGVRWISTTSTTPAVKIYTKTGDKGTTSLYTGERRAKNDKFFDALGATDELSSHIALCREFAIDSKHCYEEKLHRIQCILQDVGSLVATPKSSARESHLKNVQFSAKHVVELEEWIDEYTKMLPPLTNFILPGGGKASASIHIARTVCRRAEREITPLVAADEVDKQALIYMNRLSDFLFTLARYAAKLDNREESIYIKEHVGE